MEDKNDFVIGPLRLFVNGVEMIVLTCPCGRTSQWFTKEEMEKLKTEVSGNNIGIRCSSCSMHGTSQFKVISDLQNKFLDWVKDQYSDGRKCEGVDIADVLVWMKTAFSATKETKRNSDTIELATRTIERLESDLMYLRLQLYDNENQKLMQVSTPCCEKPSPFHRSFTEPDKPAEPDYARFDKPKKDDAV